MKRLLIALTASAALLAPLAASAQDHGHDSRGGAQAAAPAQGGHGGWQGGRGGSPGGRGGGGNPGWQGRSVQTPGPQAQARQPNAQFRGGQQGAPAGGWNNANRFAGAGNRFADNRYGGDRAFNRGGQDGRRFADNRGAGGYGHYRVGPYRWPSGYGNRRWAVNQILPRVFFGGDYFIGDFYDFGLPYPPAGEEWIRVGNDALLVDNYSGQILDVVHDVFYW